MNKIFTLLIILLLPLHLFSYEKKKDFSLIISGGISLGAYEAGYNWSLLKYLNHLKHHNKKSHIQMHSIAGASAGAINAMMSAMAWCRDSKSVDKDNMIENNLFYNIWTEVDFEDLFIDQEFGTTDNQNRTSLFSRKKIETLSEEIFLALDKPYYENGCKIPFGFATTRVEPKISQIQDIEISNKLFHIPLYLIGKNDKTAKVMDNYELSRDNIIHLSHNGNPSKDRIQKALFASSAFPLAFEHVELEYFHHNKFEKALFLDGGVFDNVPLDFAIRLSNEKADNYIFMDPKHMRRKLPPKEIEKKAHVSSPINSAVKLIGDIFSASESSILYNTLAGEFGSNEKEIQISSRYFPITGKFLEHFGAFLDKGFREYDYYVGVYDSIIDSAKYLCEERESENGKKRICQRASRRMIYEILSKDSNRSKYILNLLSMEEFGYAFDKKSYPIEPDLLAVFNSIKSLNYQDMEEFYSFIENLNKNEYKAKNSYLKHALKYPDNWYRRPLSTITQRIVTLEKDNSENLSKAFASIGAYATGAFYKTKSGYIYNPISAPLNHDELWVKSFPYELSFANNIFSLGYEHYYYFENNNFFLPKSVELKPSLSFELEDQQNQVHFARVDLNINYELKKDILTFGFGPSLYRDLDKSVDSTFGTGRNVYLDFLNIVRITYTQRDNYRGKDSYLYIGINDIPSFLYWVFD